MLLTDAAPSPIRSERDAARVASLAHAALIHEIATFPKPGLVSLVDSGSHRDMDARTLARSADAIRPYFAELAQAGERRADIAELRRIGLAAESAMMVATDGVNAHRGAIFSLGLICAIEGAREYVSGSALARAHAVEATWGAAILRRPASPSSNGGLVARRFGVGGAREEAAAGFPIIRSVGLSALREGRRLRPLDPEAARVHCFFSIMAQADDTNLLHRGGSEGLSHAKHAAVRFLRAGGVGAPTWRDEAIRTHRDFVVRGLSPGGSADLLATTLFLNDLEDG